VHLGVGWRHHFLRGGAGDAEDDFALRAFSGDDHGQIVFHAECTFLGVEAEFGFASDLIGAVAVVIPTSRDIWMIVETPLAHARGYRQSKTQMTLV